MLTYQIFHKIGIHSTLNRRRKRSIMAQQTGHSKPKTRSPESSLRYPRDALLQLFNTSAVSEAIEKFKVNGITKKREAPGKRKRPESDEAPYKPSNGSKTRTKSSRPVRQSRRLRKLPVVNVSAPTSQPSKSTLSHITDKRTSTSPTEPACATGTNENESNLELPLLSSASLAEAALQLLASQSTMGKLTSNVNNTTLNNEAREQSVSADQKGDNAHSTIHGLPRQNLQHRLLPPLRFAVNTSLLLANRDHKALLRADRVYLVRHSPSQVPLNRRGALF
ncbi:hypothetical protein F4678DRAFT_418086 [Xylaria arbuscula]|nr:hypothetical protein F4678DRAFT_418086 [Xylaria arbuscula]